MEQEFVSSHGGTIAVTHLGDRNSALPHIVWGHGWNQSGAALLPMAESLGRFAFSSLVDFPGFGHSPIPPGAWGTAEYADAVAEWLSSLPARKRIWVGHSFGCRVGLQAAARHPGLLSGMVLIAAAGLPRKRTVQERMRLVLLKRAFKVAKAFVPEGAGRDRLRSRFGSADYQQVAEPMRPILVRVVNEDLAISAAKVDCPVLLVYGSEDTETPAEIGVRLQALIPKAELVVLEGFDHLGLIGAGRQQVAHNVQRFLKSLS